MKRWEVKVIAQFSRVALDMYYAVVQHTHSHAEATMGLRSAVLVAKGLLDSTEAYDAIHELFEVYQEYIDDYQ